MESSIRDTLQKWCYICYIPQTWKTIIHSSTIDDLELYTKYWPRPIYLCWPNGDGYGDITDRLCIQIFLDALGAGKRLFSLWGMQVLPTFESMSQRFNQQQ